MLTKFSCLRLLYSYIWLYYYIIVQFCCIELLFNMDSHALYSSLVLYKLYRKKYHLPHIQPGLLLWLTCVHVGGGGEIA